MIEEALLKVYDKQNLEQNEAYAVMDEIMSGKTSPVLMSGYLTALAMKNETIDEIVGSAKAMRDHASPFDVDMDVLEIVGTGGDHSNSFNISTTSAIVLAAAGCNVAKHGNRAASSKSGAADCLEALGVDINPEPDKAKEMLASQHFCFLFAPRYHQAMKYAGPVRKELKVRTIFNILGPLCNPAHASRQLLGVFSDSYLDVMAQVLSRLGVKDGLVVYGQDRLDEISACAKTSVCEFHDGDFAFYEIEPEDFGYQKADPGDLTGGMPEENAKITLDILSGKEKGAKRNAVCMNAGAALYIDQKAGSIIEGVRMAENIIDSGLAMKKLEELTAA